MEVVDVYGCGAVVKGIGWYGRVESIGWMRRGHADMEDLDTVYMRARAGKSQVCDVASEYV
jgi:hypothetical protein